MKHENYTNKTACYFTTNTNSVSNKAVTSPSYLRRDAAALIKNSPFTLTHSVT